MGSHSVTCHPAAVTFPPLPELKLVLDLAFLDGCRVELTWVVVILQDNFFREIQSPISEITRQCHVWQCLYHLCLVTRGMEDHVHNFEMLLCPVLCVFVMFCCSVRSC